MSRDRHRPGWLDGEGGGGHGMNFSFAMMYLILKSCVRNREGKHQLGDEGGL